MKVRALSVCLAVCLCLTALCLAACGTGKKSYSRQSFDTFDTVTTVIGYADSREEFDRVADEIFGMLSDYHKLYDIYHSYEGMNNLHTVNERGAEQAVRVDGRIINLIRYGVDAYEKTDGRVNIAMGSVLSLWHDCREEALKDPDRARIPDAEQLAEAKKHTDIRGIVIEETEGAVRLTDPLLRLDVGAVAKGYAVEEIAKGLEEQGIEGYLLNVGGNVRAVGAKPDSTPWLAGVESPEGGEELAARLALTEEALISSGSYQRVFTVGAQSYHHIIDPDTAMPADRGYTLVSVVCKSSARADVLSTALFCMSLEEGRALVESLPETEALWVMKDGGQERSSGFGAYEET